MKASQRNLCLAAAAAGIAWASVSHLAAAEAKADIPAPPREFRAAWIATVANIDWPSKPGLPSEQQQAELVKLFDTAVDLNLNAVILQIRPAADAFYDSTIEPWSPYLTGKMGRPPEPYYDPLEFAVKEAHRRGLQLHVWFNPYRVRHADSQDEPSPTHASVADTNIVRQYGKYLWFDPGEPGSVKRFIDVLTDVVKRYDIDGVHIDDYFYPYQIEEAGKTVPFPDDDSYARAQVAGEKLGRDDWRRQNVNHLVEGMYKAVKKEKPWVLVGISPFGIWRPGHPKGIKGLDQYDSLYADARKWLREGWVDYFTPQLYWSVDSENKPYAKLLKWWSGENIEHRHLWPGNFTSKVSHSRRKEDSEATWSADEIIKQVKATRKTKGATGNVHYSIKALRDDYGGVAGRLKPLYAEPALIPESPWLGKETPQAPKVKVTQHSGQGSAVQLSLPERKPPWLWVVRTRTGDKWKTTIAPGSEAKVVIAADETSNPEEVAVSAVTRLGREGPVTRQPVKGQN